MTTVARFLTMLSLTSFIFPEFRLRTASTPASRAALISTGSRVSMLRGKSVTDFAIFTAAPASCGSVSMDMPRSMISAPSFAK